MIETTLMTVNRIDDLSEKIESDERMSVNERSSEMNENEICYDHSIDQCVDETCAAGFPAYAGVNGVQWWLLPYQEFYHALARGHSQCLALTYHPKTL